MKHFKNLIITFFLLLSISNYAQDFDGYKYVVIDNKDFRTKVNDKYGVTDMIAQFFKSKGFKIVIGSDSSLFPEELIRNNCKGLYVKYFKTNQAVSLIFLNCKREVVKNLISSIGTTYQDAFNGFFTELNKQKNYSYDEKLTPIIETPVKVEKVNKSEAELKIYLDSNKIEPIEGIYKSYKSEEFYKIGIIKVDDIYKAILLESNKSNWVNGEIKAEFESTAVEGVFSIKFYNENKILIETFANLEGGLLTVELKNPEGEDINMKFLKLYPKK
jgi:hypothetical protein